MPPAQAGSLDVSPIFLEFPAGRRAATLEIGNRGGKTTAVQIRAFAWSQAGDEDRLVPTQDIILSPPAATVAAGDAQVVRMLVRRPTGAAERDYRLLVDELPPAGGSRQIVVAMRFSLPVVIAGTASARAELQWQAEASPGNRLVLTARNAGARSLRINDLEVMLPGGHTYVAHAFGGNPFVLPGAVRRWHIDGLAGTVQGGPLHLTAKTSVGVREQVVTPMP